MDIKEQKPNVIKELDDYILVVCNNWSDYDHAIEVKHLITIDEVVAKIQSIYEQAGYIQLQADEKGLVSMGTIQELVKLPDGNNHCVYVHDVNIAKAQKALTESQVKQKQAEAVKKVFDWIEKELDTRIGNGNYEVSLDEIRLRCSSADLEFVWNEIKSDIKAFKRQTLEELEEKE